MKVYLLKMPCQSVYVIETDCPIIGSRITLKYGQHIVETDTTATPDISILKEGDEYTVTVGSVSKKTSRPIFYLNRFLFENPSYSSDMLALHGGAVEHCGKAYVFLAATTTGKTTLTSYLVSQGCGYITDDCVLLERASLMIYPFAKPLHLRAGGVEVLKKYNALPPSLELLSEQEGNDRYVYTPQNSVEKPLPLGEIFFIERTESENSVFQMTGAEKIAALMRSPITVYPVTADYLHFLSKLGREFGKRLKYCDMNFVKEVIENYER
ncbi:MAG: hypothetical protein E7589_04065 [Ruminococcaceae bacterium]|nr:hypothetical protein [Oscillospiraceae bacterium]